MAMPYCSLLRTAAVALLNHKIRLLLCGGRRYALRKKPDVVRFFYIAEMIESRGNDKTPGGVQQFRRGFWERITI